jgi:DNA-binding NtrC family response regulator
MTTIVLVACDDVSLVNRLDWLLTEAGFRVEIVASVAAVRAALASHRSCALVIVDIRIADGASVVNLATSVPLIVLGNAPAVVRECVEQGGGAVIDGPIGPALRGRLVGVLH